ncbi:hypothetical protein CLV43_11869 [Umezawaea tangerina]|uniref:Uncharacterized protein n=1 Tax=Umezawaea tangerina TaxID=84725 RepID=A0A2T0SKY1_9PSEU|nr:hypothetical protein CLV43_11869 [Umezawaea tangerina]
MAKPPRASPSGGSASGGNDSDRDPARPRDHLPAHPNLKGLHRPRRRARPGAGFRYAGASGFAVGHRGRTSLGRAAVTGSGTGSGNRPVGIWARGCTPPPAVRCHCSLIGTTACRYCLLPHHPALLLGTNSALPALTTQACPPTRTNPRTAHPRCWPLPTPPPRATPKLTRRSSPAEAHVPKLTRRSPPAQAHPPKLTCPSSPAQAHLPKFTCRSSPAEAHLSTPASLLLSARTGRPAPPPPHPVPLAQARPPVPACTSTAIRSRYSEPTQLERGKPVTSDARLASPPTPHPPPSPDRLKTKDPRPPGRGGLRAEQAQVRV